MTTRLKTPTLDTLEFCGKHIAIPEISFCVAADNWESTSMLSCISPNNTSRALARDPGFREILRNDATSEFDANNLCDYLEKRVQAGSLVLSAEFMKFEKAWRRDEMNHALGFAMLEAFLYDVTVEDVFAELRSAEPNFTPLAERGFFEDEFTTAVVIAYDEISTTLSYRDDQITRYPKFNNPVMIEWIRRVANDEGHHFRNIVSLIKTKHANRICEIPKLVERIWEWELSEHTYGRTFVLDHTGEQFTRGFMLNALDKLLKQFRFNVRDLQCGVG
jgi:hypothetical protein